MNVVKLIQFVNSSFGANKKLQKFIVQFHNMYLSHEYHDNSSNQNYITS